MKPNRLVIWVVGEPGAGKTHLVRDLLGKRPAVLQSGKIKWTVSEDGTMVAAGTYRGEAFDGADTVPYDGARTNLEFWNDAFQDKLVTILDGDRFSNMGVVEWFRKHVPDAELWVVHLDTPAHVACARREARGGKQNATWVKGRGTKAKRFYEAATALHGVGGLMDREMTPGSLSRLIASRLGSKS